MIEPLLQRLRIPARDDSGDGEDAAGEENAGG